MFIGINTKPKYQVRLSPNRGGQNRNDSNKAGCVLRTQYGQRNINIGIL